MRSVKAVFAVLVVLAFAACGRAEITSPGGAQADAGKSRTRATTPPEEVVADSTYSRSGGAFGLGSGG